MRLPILIGLLVFCTGVASAAPNKIKHNPLNPTQGPLLVGHLEVLWGDSHDGAPPIMRVSLALDEGGQRIELDPVQASKGASDLASLVGRRVAIQFAPLQAGRDPPTIQAIVSAEQAVYADGSPMVASPVSGSTAWVSVACKFSDKMLEPVSAKWMGNQMGRMRGGLDHYWRLMSYNHINLTGSASYGWFTLPHTEAYYQGEFSTSNLDILKQDCLDAADSAVNFSKFQNIKMSFNGQTPQDRSWGGKRCETLDGLYACRGVVWMNSRSLSSAPVIAHEMGHGYGLWHSDNSDEDDNTYDNVWDIMSSTSKTFVDSHPVFGNQPRFLGMIQRYRLGWIAPHQMKHIVIQPAMCTSRLIHLDFASQHNGEGVQAIFLRIPLNAQPVPNPSNCLAGKRPIPIVEQRSDKLFVIEARSSYAPYAKGFGEAVIIHYANRHADIPKSVDADTPASDWSSNEGSMFREGESWSTWQRYDTPPGSGATIRIIEKTFTGFWVAIDPP